MIRTIFLITFFSMILSCKSKSSNQNQKVNTKLENIENAGQISSLDSDTYFVYKVIDGDTFYCYDENKNEVKVRLIGIDTPETRNRFKKKKGHYGIEAKNYLTELILNQSIKLDFDLDKYDQYNRVLAYAYKDNVFINADLVKNGYARIMTIQPNSKYADLFYKLQIQARDNKIGLWAFEEY